MNIKTIAGNVALLILLPIGINAQYPTQNQQTLQTNTQPGTNIKNIDRRAMEKMSKLDAVVHLTADQKSELRPTYIKMERQKYQNDQTISDKETLKQMNNRLDREKWKAWHSLLNPDQLKAWEEYRKEHAAEEY